MKTQKQTRKEIDADLAMNYIILTKVTMDNQIFKALAEAEDKEKVK